MAFATPSSIRITSTYVENTDVKLKYETDDQDHLHLRGEHFCSLLIEVAVAGSPPLTWRTLTSEKIDVIEEQDHLHLRGEHTKRSL